MKKTHGYIALTSILVILAATLAVAISANLLSIDTGKTSLTLEDGINAFALANGCVEEGTIRLKRDNSYAGGSLNTANGSCTITVQVNSTQRIVTAEATVDLVTRRVTAQIDFAPNFSYDSWEEQ